MEQRRVMESKRSSRERGWAQVAGTPSGGAGTPEYREYLIDYLIVLSASPDALEGVAYLHNASSRKG